MGNSQTNIFIFEHQVETFEIRKIRKFKKYHGKEYTENIIW